MLNRRILAQAKRCQRLTGSFDGNLMACPCDKSNDCTFSDNELRILQHNPTIKRRKALNLIKHEWLNDDHTHSLWEHQGAYYRINNETEEIKTLSFNGNWIDTPISIFHARSTFTPCKP